MKKTVIIKRSTNSFEQYYSTAFNNMGISCYDPYVKNNNFMELVCHIMMHFSLPFYKKFYGDWVNYVKDADVVIIFDWIYSHKIIEDIKRINPNCKVIFWIWNKIIPRIQNKMLNKYHSVYWTFDPSDAQKYELNLNTQFYAISKNDLNNLKAKRKEIENDVFFCGKDKGRVEKVINIKNELDKAKLRFNCNLIKDETSKDINKFEYSSKELKYNDIIEEINKSKCILDLTQKDQSGLTIRSLEALFYCKLLITDNRSIKKAKFYNKDKIYIIGEDKRTLKEFLSEDLPKYSNKQKEYYCIDDWLERFGA